MWHPRNNRDGETVVCIACGTSLPRSDAREYDKEGNRWQRHGKSFEHLCKECYRGLCHQPRDELEPLLVDVERSIEGDGTTPGRDAGANLPADPDATLPERGDGPDRSDAAASDDPDRTFLAAYFCAVEERYGPAEEPDPDTE